MDKAKKGFSLIELIVVITVLGVIITVLLPRVIHSRAQSQLEMCKQNMRSLAMAFEMYANEDPANKYPKPLEADGADAIAALIPKYIKTKPTCPASSGESYTYECTSDAKLFTTFCKSEKAHEEVGISAGQLYYESNKGFGIKQ